MRPYSALALILGCLICWNIPARAETIRLQKVGGVYTVPVRVNGAITLNFILDSGASDILIPANIALTLLRSGALSDADFRGTGTYRLANGATENNQRVILHKLQVGNVTLANVPASVGSIKGHLLLGQSFLSRLKSWSVDNTTHSLIIGTPGNPVNAPGMEGKEAETAKIGSFRVQDLDRARTGDARVALIRATIALGGRCPAPMIPVTVYVDGKSASAEEIVRAVGAFNRYQRASDAYQQCLIGGLAELRQQAAASSPPTEVDPLVEQGVAELIASTRKAKEKAGKTLEVAVQLHKAGHR